MDPNLEAESRKLAQSWEQHDAAHLQDYLVSGVEDPRLHFQSILTRHFLTTVLFGAKFDGLKVQELRFAAFQNWLLLMLRRRVLAEDWHAILHALEHKSDNAEGFEIPWFVVKLFGVLPAEVTGGTIPNYIRDTLSSLREQPADDAAAARKVCDLALFERLWPAALAGEEPQVLSACEIACGSANDYRFIDMFGLGQFLDYTGIDISEKNITNAKALFPGKRFLTGNVFSLPLEARSAKVVFFQDLLEHLSPDGLETAVAEICRVTDQQICAGYFSMHEGPDHLVRPVEDYHCNTLSRSRMEILFARHGFRSRPVHIDSYVRSELGLFTWHNANAYTVFLDRLS